MASQKMTLTEALRDDEIRFFALYHRHHVFHFTCTKSNVQTARGYYKMLRSVPNVIIWRQQKRALSTDNQQTPSFSQLMSLDLYMELHHQQCFSI
jgi:hypothetical protein